MYNFILPSITELITANLRQDEGGSYTAEATKVGKKWSQVFSILDRYSSIALVSLVCAHQAELSRRNDSFAPFDIVLPQCITYTHRVRNDKDAHTDAMLLGSKLAAR
jgi:hypothetical protein